MMDGNLNLQFKHLLSNSRIIGLIASAFVLLLACQVQALEQWNLPIEKELKSLKVFNRDSQARPLWISGPISEYKDPMEYSFEIPAFGTLEIPLNQFSDLPWIHLKTQNPGVFQIQILTAFETAILLQSGPSLLWKSQVRGPSEAVILNLAPFEQLITIKKNGHQIRTLSVPAQEKVRVTLEPNSSGGMLSLEGQARIAGLLISPQTTKTFAPDSTKAQLSPLDHSETHYFRLSNKGNRQSYVARISDPDLVAQAQLQVSQPNQSLPRILIGQIDFENGGHNRDFSDVRSTPWSWNITKVIRFSQLASQDCDGSPEMLEEVLKPWKENTRIICFWGYRIVEELTPEQIRTGQLSRPPVPWSLRREPEFEARPVF